MSAVAIVDSGANYASLCGALSRVGAEFDVTADPSTLRAAPRVILPGVGHVGDTWSRLENNDLLDVIRNLTQPLLGICVGMQVMFDYCEEAGIDGLGLFDGAVTRLTASPAIRVPHSGWNELDIRRECALTAKLDRTPKPYAYFVHSFAAPMTSATTASCNHGQHFSAIVARNNVFGVQFHPERSACVGRQILAAFLEL